MTTAGARRVPRLGISASWANVASTLVIALAAAFLLVKGAATVAQLLGAGGFQCCWDEKIYHDATARWLAGDGFYLPHQLAGPYVAKAPDVLYPPSSLWLFLPFQVLPRFLWYAVPLGVTVWGLVTFRPKWWAWVAVVILVLYEWTVPLVLLGNPVMWAYTFLWLGLRYSGLAVGVLLKPSLFPFALFGANRKQWWLVLGVAFLAALPFGLMWLDYLTVVLNARGTEYLIRSVPMMLIPLVAWAGRTRLRKPEPVPEPDHIRL
jgi:hypothetical protein